MPVTAPTDYSADGRRPCGEAAGRHEAPDLRANPDPRANPDLRANPELRARPSSEGGASVADLLARIAGLEHDLGDLSARHLALLEHLHDIVFALDVEGSISHVAGNTMGILGLAPYEAAGLASDRWASLVHPADLPTILGWLDDRPTGALSTLVRLRDVAGEYRWLEVSLSPLLTVDEDRSLGWHGVARDVTDRVRAERTMASLNRAAEVVQVAGLSPANVFQAVTDQLAELELSSAILVLDDDDSLSLGAQRSARDARPGPGPEAVASGVRRPVESVPRLAQALREKRPLCLPITEGLLQEVASCGALLLTAGGPPSAWHHAIAAPMVAGGEVSGLLLVAGVTIGPLYLPSVAAFANQTAIAYRNAQLLQGLRESEEQYRNIFASVTDGLTIFDEDGYILAVNPAACRIYGYSVDELVGMHLSTLVHPDHYHGLENFRRAIAETGMFHGQAVNIRKDGTHIDVEIHGTAFIYQGKRRLLSVDTDVTERVQSQRALMRAEKLRTLGQMAGGIAHDFNNLLASIRGFAHLALLEMQENPAAASDDLRMALLSTSDAAEAVRRIQSLYRQGDDTSDFHPLRLDGVVDEVLALTQPHWKDVPQSRGCTIRVVTEIDAQATVMANAGELRRVLSNLVMNAVDAMPEGGTLTLRVATEGEWCTVDVTDTGVGMTAGQQAQVFEPFFTTKGTAGSGLGLTMSQGIVERHGGSISVQSAPGHGSTFTVRLPVSLEQIGLEPPAAADAERLALRRLRVLVVDDDDAVRSVLCRVLEREGQEVASASGGEAALAMLREEAYDLLITDLGMPNISGHQVARFAHDLYPAMPVILATGWGDTISPEQLASLGATTLLSKPYAYEDVVRAVHTAMQGGERR